MRSTDSVTIFLKIYVLMIFFSFIALLHRFTLSPKKNQYQIKWDWNLDNFAERFELIFGKPLTVPKEKDVLQYLSELGFLKALPGGMCGSCRFEVDLSYWDEHMEEMSNFPVDKSRVSKPNFFTTL